MPKTITHEQWCKKYDKAASAQGWSLFDEGSVLAIEKIDNPEDGGAKFKSDDQAIRKVIRNAREGCLMSILALYLHNADRLASMPV